MWGRALCQSSEYTPAVCTWNLSLQSYLCRVFHARAQSRVHAETHAVLSQSVKQNHRLKKVTVLNF